MDSKVKVFTFHGCDIEEKGEQARGSCPFCDKENHFYVSAMTGQFSCKSCGVKGNAASFLQLLWKQSGNTSTKELQAFADDRGIALQVMLDWGIRTSLIDGAIILPSYNLTGALSNLSRVVQIDGSWKVLSSPQMKQHPFGTQLINKNGRYLWICEGPWDGMALYETLGKISVRNKAYQQCSNPADSLLQTHSIIAVPGCQTFSDEWLTYFKGREVRICYDNDHPRMNPQNATYQPGWDGMKRVIRIASEKGHEATAVKLLYWGADGYNLEIPDGYDIRDLCHNRPPVSVLSYLSQKLKPVKTILPKENREPPVEVIQPIECTSFDQLFQEFGQVLHTNAAMRATLITMIATVISTRLPGEQLWFRVLGPPGSGKTTFAECLSVAREFCFPNSIMTGFHSGMRSHGPNSKKTNSLIPDIDGKCVIIKDADTMVNASNKEKTNSELRDIYDGTTRTRYRNSVRADYDNLRTTFLLCGTDALRSLNRTFLGERFLDSDILGQSDTSAYLSSAFRNAINQVTRGITREDNEAHGAAKRRLKQLTYGFLLHIVARLEKGDIVPPVPTQADEDRVNALAMLLAFMRARVEREKDEMIYRPRVEIGTRLCAQFAKFIVALTVVLDKTSFDQEVYTILTKIMRDTAYGYPFEIAELMFREKSGLSCEQIAARLRLPVTNVRAYLNDMAELDIIEHTEVPNNSGVRGRHIHLWSLTEELRMLFVGAGFARRPVPLRKHPV